MSKARDISQAGAELPTINSLLNFSSANQPYVYVRGYSTPGDGGGGHYSYINGDTSSGAYGTGSIAGNVFYVVTTTNGTWANNQMLSGNGVVSGTYIYNKSAPGVFNVNIPQTVASTVMTGCNGGSTIVSFDGARWKLDADVMPTATQFGATINDSTDDYYPLLNLYQATQPLNPPSSPNPLQYDVLSTNASIVCGNIVSYGNVAITENLTVTSAITANSATLSQFPNLKTQANAVPGYWQTWSYVAPLSYGLLVLGTTYQNLNNYPEIVTCSVTSGNNSLWTVMGNISPTLPTNLTNPACVQVFYAGLNGAGGSIINASMMVPAQFHYEFASSDGGASIIRTAIYQ